jgi:glycosyltransferase involved in cell wall biosynthesis
MRKKLKILSLGYTRELLVPIQEAASDTPKRLAYYSVFLKKYFVVVFTLKKHNLKRKEVGTLTAIPTNGTNRLDALWKMYQIGRKICRVHGVDLIQTQEPFFTGVIGLLLSKRFKVPLNVCVYGCDPYDEHWLGEKTTNRLLAPVAKYILRRADGIQVDGLKVLDSLKEKGKLPASKIFYKPIVPKDIDFFKKAEAKNVREWLLKGGEDKILLFVGRLVSQKNLPFLFRCFQKISEEYPKVRLVIIGEGNQELMLKDLANNLNIQESIDWLNRIPYSKMPKYFSAADVFVMPSLYEGFARVLMEAAMAGKPIVSTDVGGTEDVIEDKQSGFVIDHGDENEFVEKVLFLLRDPEIAREMGAKGQEIMETRFDPEKTLFEQVNIWDNLTQYQRDFLNE